MKAKFVGVYEEYLPFDITRFLSESGKLNFLFNERKRYEKEGLTFGEEYEIILLDEPYGFYDAEVVIPIHGKSKKVFVSTCFFVLKTWVDEEDTKTIPIFELLNLYGCGKSIELVDCIVNSYNSKVYRNAEEALETLVGLIDTAQETLNSTYNAKVDELDIDNYDIVPMDVKVKKQ